MQALHQRSLKILAGAVRKVRNNFPNGLPPRPEVNLPDASSVRIPETPASLNLNEAGGHGSEGLS